MLALIHISPHLRKSISTGGGGGSFFFFSPFHEGRGQGEKVCGTHCQQYSLLLVLSSCSPLKAPIWKSHFLEWRFKMEYSAKPGKGPSTFPTGQMRRKMPVLQNWWRYSTSSLSSENPALCASSVKWMTLMSITRKYYYVTIIAITPLISQSLVSKHTMNTHGQVG